MKISRRHERLSLRTRVVRKIEDIPADDWKNIFPETLEGYDFFRTLDESGLDQFSFYYIMVYKKKKPVGAVPCFLMNYSLDTSISGPLRRISNSIKRIMPNIFSIRTLICGIPMGPGRIGIDGHPDKVLKAVLRRLERIARKKRAAIIAFKDFGHEYTKVLDPLQKEGFVKAESLPNTEMNVWFKDFEEYMKTLSYATRYDLKRKFKKVDGHVKIDLEIVGTPDERDLSEIYRLYLEMGIKHEMGFEILPIGFFKNIPKNMPKHTKFFLWKIDGRLAAFLFCLVSDEVLMDYYIGLDYTVAHKYHLYFIKFRDVMNWCIKHKIKRYEMGYTGYEPKKRLGFDLVPQYIYAKLRNRMLRPVLKLLVQLLKFENFDPTLKQAKRAKKK